MTDIIDTFEPLLRAIHDGRRAFKAEHDGDQPSKMFCSQEAFFYLKQQIVSGELKEPPVKVYSFRADPLEVHVDRALTGLELKFE